MQKEFHSLVKSIVIYGFGNVSVKLIGLILLPLYSNPSFLTVDEYGVLGLFDISSQILVSLFSLSLSSAYLRWYWDKAYFETRKIIFFTCFATLSCLAILLAVSGILASGAVSSVLFGNKNFAHAFALMAVASGMQTLIDLTLTQMRAENKASFFVSTNITRLVISLGSTIYLVRFANHGISGIYEAQVIGNVSFLLLTSRFFIRNMESKFSTSILKEILSFSMPLALASLSNVLLAAFDRFVLEAKTTLLDVGIYTQGYRIANTTKVFIVNSVQLALAPAVFKIMNRPDSKEIYSKIMTWFTIIVVLFSLFLSLFGLEITKLFTTGKIYFDAYKLIPIFSLGIIFGMLKDVSVIGLQITKKTKIIGVVLSGIAVINLLLNMLLVPLWGVYGASMSSVISQLIFFLLMFFFAQKHFRIPYRLDKVCIIIISGIAVYLAGSISNSSDLGTRIIVKSIAILLFPILLFVFRVVDQTEIKMITSVVNKIKGIFMQSKKEDLAQSISETEVENIKPE